MFGWGSEAVLCAWGMRDDAVDNETALQIRETTSALVYLIVVLPIFGAWAFTWNAIPNPGTAVVALAALAGTCSYLFYYKGISVIGAARGMALNISYSAWAVLFGLILLGHRARPGGDRLLHRHPLRHDSGRLRLGRVVRHQEGRGVTLSSCLNPATEPWPSRPVSRAFHGRRSP